jgi:RsiW-degrading membrane proteinase PrsW (M82 family)
MEPLMFLVLSALTILASVAPAVVYSLVVWWLDRYEKEPLGLLAATFFWGAVPAILLALLAEFVLGIPFASLLEQPAAQFISGSLVAPLVEESVKGVAILLLFLLFRHEFDGILDGIVYGALVGFGFAMTENGLYLLGAMAEGGAGVWLTVVFVRTLVFGLNHGLFSAIVGMGLGYAATTSNAFARWGTPPLALILAIVVHSVHNLSTALAADMGWPILISLVNNWGGVAVLLVMVLLSWDRERSWIVRELEPEVRAGLLSPLEHSTVASYGRRVGAQWGALSRQGLGEARSVRKFHQLATDLAFAKRRLRVSPDDVALERAVDHFRSELAHLKEGMSES